MRLRDRDVLFRSTLAASFSIAAAMLAVLLIGLWGAQRELSDIRATMLRSEITHDSGFDQSRFDEQVARQQRSARNRWIVIIGAIFAVVLLAAVSLHRINRRSAALQQAISMAHVKQFTDLGRLVGALAHEIRNPLNAIRLNLHALWNVLQGSATLSGDEIQQVVEESNREIDRLSQLMKTMLGYARPDQAVVEEVELNDELEAISSFLAPVMERESVDLVVTLPDAPVSVAIDPDRLRQILLNLLNNAREAAGAGGQVALSLSSTGDRAEITVADNGPGVPAADRDRIFDAFYSTRETGTGLGLALVKRFVEEAGGSVVCDDRIAAGHYSGAVFRVALPTVSATQSATHEDESTPAEVAGVA